jgi:hypothetical protein
MTREEDLAKLSAMSKKVWQRHEGGKTGPYSTEKRALTKLEAARVLRIFRKHQDTLVFEPGSGVFGFGVSLSVWDPPLYPDAGATYIVGFTGKHFFPDETAYDRKSYTLFEEFVYTNKNKSLRKFSGFKRELQPMSWYDY